MWTVSKLKGAIEEFSTQAKNSGNIDSFIKKAISAKCFNTLANVGLSSVLLAIVLPKLQFLFRKITQGTNLDPGVREYK